MKNNTTPTIDLVGKSHIEGNITPPVWYRRIRSNKGRTDHIAVATLADVWAWYRPQYIKDEETNEIIEVRRRFKKEKLQRSYQQIANTFGCSKENAKDAINLLVEMGLIRKTWWSGVENGTYLSNVLFLEPVVDEVMRLTHEENYTQKQITPVGENDEGVGGQNTPLLGGQNGEEGGGQNTPDVHLISTQSQPMSDTDELFTEEDRQKANQPREKRTVEQIKEGVKQAIAEFGQSGGKKRGVADANVSREERKEQIAGWLSELMRYNEPTSSINKVAQQIISKPYDDNWIQRELARLDRSGEFRKDGASVYWVPGKLEDAWALKVQSEEKVWVFSN